MQGIEPPEHGGRREATLHMPSHDTGSHTTEGYTY